MTCRWQNLGKLSLLVTLTLGIIYRLQFAGIHFSLFDHKNLHQAHTHMGFYGALAGLVMAQKIFSSHTILKPMWEIFPKVVDLIIKKRRPRDVFDQVS